MRAAGPFLIGRVRAVASPTTSIFDERRVGDLVRCRGKHLVAHVVSVVVFLWPGLALFHRWLGGHCRREVTNEVRFAHDSRGPGVVCHRRGVIVRLYARGQERERTRERSPRPSCSSLQPSVS